MTTKTVKYGISGWVFMKAVLDDALYKFIMEHYDIRDFRFKQSWEEVHAGLRVGTDRQNGGRSDGGLSAGIWMVA
jgi:hypothetical protein